jgi:hypothetical protein
MPAATPLPRSPSVLTLYSAADLLTGPGCPVCRYTGEASERYLTWFALEGCAQPASITRLCKSLGMCPRHTRGLMSQPGAAPRLTAVNRYLVRAARDQLTGRTTVHAGCPACEHDDQAMSRAVDTLLDGLADGSVQERYRELGGLCIPHVRAASARSSHRLAGWLAETVLAAVTQSPLPSPRWLAGTDHDAEARAVLRNTSPATFRRGADACVACLAAARSEHGDLAALLRSSVGGRPDRRQVLCAGHLGDLAVLAGPDDIQRLLTWQAGCLIAAVSRLSGPRLRRNGPPLRWLRPGRALAASTDECAVCLRRADAAAQAIEEISTLLRADQPDPHHCAPMCVRHLLAMRRADRWAGQVTALGAVEHADVLIAELEEAFRKRTWAGRQEPRGQEMTAWRRAAAFLDGGVLCGRPPREA